MVAQETAELIPGTTWEEYGRIEGVTQSILKRFRKSPAHAHHEIVSPRTPTPALELGHAVHYAVLEPAQFLERFIAAPKVDRRTKIGKETWAAFQLEHGDKEVVTDEQFETCIHISNACWSHPVASELLSGEGSNEVVARWQRDGLPCKARLDRVTTYGGWSVVGDLKTCEDAGEWAFGGACHTYGYHNQGAWYLDGLDMVAARERKFVLIAVEKSPPWALQCYVMDEPSLMQGRDENDKNFTRYAECQRTGEWPGYETKLKSLSIPQWAIKPDEWEAPA